MRDRAFYWKCDCPGSAETKKNTYFSDKHTPENSAVAREIAAGFLGWQPAGFRCLKVEGNHFAYRFSDQDRKFLLRTDDGLTDDDYMAAESAVMALLHKHELPVPEVYETNTEPGKYPVRYQVMEFIEYPTLQSLSRENKLDMVAIARQFGHFLAGLHEIQLSGFGFIDTKKLKAQAGLQGRDGAWQDYFCKCLDQHLGYLRDREFLAGGVIQRIEKIFASRQDLLQIGKGSLLHRDFAFWNILGTVDEIKAVIDWDDTVIGDPADDLGIVNCFNNQEFMENLLAVYSLRHQVDDIFRVKIHFYTLRNMLWKAMIRHYMGYFDQDENFFLNKKDSNLSLKELTINKIMQSLEKLEKL